MHQNLREIGLNGRVRRAKPLLTDDHIVKCQDWLEKHCDWQLEDWKKVWFSDKSKFNLFGSDGRHYCRRRPGEEYLKRNVKKTVKHGGGSVMVWGCISWKGTGRLVRIEGIMDRYKYCDILEDGLLGSLHDQGLRASEIIFQQDSDPKHTAHFTKGWLRDHGIKTHPWAPQSADLNIIEHGWEQLDRQIRRRNPLPKNKDELWQALKEEWENIDLERVRELYQSCPRRVQALADANGAYTKY
ncbi:hypothetical protein HWV62_27229 [Athelia sp. TMB]|nr:hypothetical protein HWV62_27229 [Athelia sp. TMB]